MGMRPKRRSVMRVSERRDEREERRLWRWGWELGFEGERGRRVEMRARV